MVLRWVAAGAIASLANGQGQSVAGDSSTTARRTQVRALADAVTARARKRAASRPVPDSIQAAAELGRDTAVMLLATARTAGMDVATAGFAVADLAADLERLKHADRALHEVAQIELLAHTRRQVLQSAAQSGACPETLAHMRQVMMRRPYLARLQPAQLAA